MKREIILSKVVNDVDEQTYRTAGVFGAIGLFIYSVIFGYKMYVA